MANLVLRSDVVTLKTTTETLQCDLGIDIHEAADIVLAALREHGPSIQFWKVPSKGLPYKDGEPAQESYASKWLESRWWDQEYQDRQNEIHELTKDLTRARPIRDDEKIEEMAMLRKDAYRLFLSDALDMAAERCTARPKIQLVSITKLLSLISLHSGGQVQVPELAVAFGDLYDADRTMIYLCGTGFLCDPINGMRGGYNKRADISCDFTNCKNDLDSDHDQYLIHKDDAVTITRQIWKNFFDEDLFDPYETLNLGDSSDGALQTNETTTFLDNGSNTGKVNPHGYLDPTNPRYAPKLAAAVLAWQAMADANLMRGKTPLTAMEDWLEARSTELRLVHRNDNPSNSTKAGDINKTAIAEAAKVANWLPGGGVPKTPGT